MTGELTRAARGRTGFTCRRAHPDGERPGVLGRQRSSQMGTPSASRCNIKCRVAVPESTRPTCSTMHLDTFDHNPTAVFRLAAGSVRQVASRDLAYFLEPISLDDVQEDHRGD